MCHWDPCETRVLIVWYNATVFPCTGSLTQVITGSIGGFRAWQIDIDWCVVSLCFILNALKFDYLTSGSDFAMYINAELRQCSVNFIWQFYNAQAKSNSRDADIWFHFMQYSMAQIQFQRRRIVCVEYSNSVWVFDVASYFARTTFCGCTWWHISAQSLISLFFKDHSS